MRRLRNYGGVGRFDHQVRGINSRLDEMQAAVLRAKLPYLNEMNRQRRKRAVQYHYALADSGIGLPMHAKANFHQYVIRSPRRDQLQLDLRERGIDTHVHYPVPPYLEPAYADMGVKRGTFPVTERLAKEVLSLPIGYDVDVERVARAVVDCARDEVAA